MNTSTDSRLLDTAAAVEAMPTLRLGQSSVAPTVAPSAGSSRALEDSLTAKVPLSRMGGRPDFRRFVRACQSQQGDPISLTGFVQPAESVIHSELQGPRRCNMVNEELAINIQYAARLQTVL